MKLHFAWAASPLLVLAAFAPRATQQAAPSAAAPKPAAPPAAAEARPNLVIVTMDTTRADQLGCYGYVRPTTPQIDALARESTLFESCYTALTHTTPSHTSLFTGVYPFEHGVLSCSFRAADEVQQQRAFASVPALRSYAEILASHGWSTGGFVTGATTKKVTGLAAGFEAWSEPADVVRPGAEATADAIAWLDTAKEPFLLWVHYFDAHIPPREEYVKVHPELEPDAKLRAVIAERRISPTRRPAGSVAPGKDSPAARANYDREIDIARYDTGLRMIDDHVAALRAKLEARGAWPRTTVVIFGDHGEGLGQHHFVEHGPVWREQTRVPFVLRVPGRAPERVATVCSTIDILATAIAATPGLPRDEFAAQARGSDVLAHEFEERPVFSMSPPTRGEYSLTTARWRWIHRNRGKHALYDLQNDPHELTDVQAKHPDVAAALDRQLLQLIKEQRERYAEIYGDSHPGTRLTRDQEAQLKAELQKLGYVDGDGEEAGTPHEDGEHDEARDDEHDDEHDDGTGGDEEGGRAPRR